MRKVFIVGFLLMAMGIQAQDVVGKWYHYDVDTGTRNSRIETYIRNDSLFARIDHLFVSDQPDTLVCVGCPGHWKDKKILGLDIVYGLTLKDDKWEGDDAIIDVEVASVYDCKVWYEDGNLKVRGYLGFFYDTFTWYPVDGPQPTDKKQAK